MERPKYNPLTPQETFVIENKGTEPPFSGEFDNFFGSGTYICRRCDSELFRSTNKFDAQCGWPAFDKEITGSIIQSPDPDGHRTEISCSNCGGHLGHMFIGEGFTETNTRHCVNSLSINFLDSPSKPQS